MNIWASAVEVFRARWAANGGPAVQVEDGVRVRVEISLWPSYSLIEDLPLTSL